MEGGTLKLESSLDVKQGKIICHLKEVMQDREISVYRLSFITGIKYEVLKRYYDNLILRYDSSILTKLCFYLDCDLNSILKYEK